MGRRTFMFRYTQEVVNVVVTALTVLFWSGMTCLGKPLPAQFIFGDSLVDAGNNNYLVTLSKANFPPYGIDFGMPTGRYTNGRTITDILGQELGEKDFRPPYLAPTTVGPVVLKGVNYASGGGGILNETGYIFIGRLNMDAQLDNFANTRHDIISRIDVPATQDLLNKALYSVTMGSNDFINNYLTPVLSTKEQKRVSPEEFVGIMISRFRGQLKRLYYFGARKIVVSNVGPIGCIPYVRDTNMSGEKCAALPNHLAQLFNSQLKSLLEDLNNSLEGSLFIYADVNRIVNDIIQKFKSYGFDNGDHACCRVLGQHGGLVPCGPKSKVCPDRSKYVFWDPYHPTDTANVIIAKRLLDGGIEDISPINIRALLNLESED